MSEAKEVEITLVGNGFGTLDESTEHDPHFDPIVTLPLVQVPTMEEEEIELLKLRAKLFRYDTHQDPPEWKERGTGEVKLLQHKEKNTIRVVMRRDKTLKICANHFVTPFMELKPNCGSDRAWVWSVPADFADETAKSELLAIRFANSDNAKKWKDVFEMAKQTVATQCSLFMSHQGNESANSESDELSASSISENEEDGEVSKQDEVPNEVTASLTELKLSEKPADVKDDGSSIKEASDTKSSTE